MNPLHKKPNKVRRIAIVNWLGSYLASNQIHLVRF